MEYHRKIRRRRYNYIACCSYPQNVSVSDEEQTNVIDTYAPNQAQFTYYSCSRKVEYQLVTINKKAEEATFISWWTNWVTSLPVSGIDLILLPMT